MFVGITAVQTASFSTELLEWLVPLAIMLCGFAVIKKSKNKAGRTAGTLIAAGGFLWIMWLVLWQIVAVIAYYGGM